MRGGVYRGMVRTRVVGEKYTTQDGETCSQAEIVSSLRAFPLYDVAREAPRNEFEVCRSVDFFWQRA